MLKCVIISILLFDVGFVFGAGWGHLRREKSDVKN